MHQNQQTVNPTVITRFALYAHQKQSVFTVRFDYKIQQFPVNEGATGIDLLIKFICLASMVTE